MTKVGCVNIILIKSNEGRPTQSFCQIQIRNIFIEYIRMLSHLVCLHMQIVLEKELGAGDRS